MPTDANLTIAIPVFQPDTGFVEHVRKLAREPIRAIVVVDDGSGPAYRHRFQEVQELARVHVLRHLSNRGKGAALKTAMTYALTTFPGCIGVVTADGDGQHHPRDIVRVASRLIENPGCLCLGARQFEHGVPWRSRFGNHFARMMARFVVRKPLGDTQTGLRGIPPVLLPDLVRIPKNGYEFEMEMLICATERGIEIIEEPVRTIYKEGNRGSHFRPVFDSSRILLVLVRASAAKLLQALLPGSARQRVMRAAGSVTD